MGLPSWVYEKEKDDSLIQWEDRGTHFYDRRTGETRPKGIAGGHPKGWDLDRSNIEDRRGDAPTYAPPGVSGGPLKPPQGWPNGWDETYDPRYVEPDGRFRKDLPAEVKKGIDEASEFTHLREERELIDDNYEPTKSPLVLRKRNANGTVTHVHALTGQPLFDLGEYGLNDPQRDSEIDPYWRGGRRDW